MSLISNKDIQKLQVSSFFDKNFGKQNIFDGNEETCWRSDEGIPQWISLEFRQPQKVSNFSIQFQGGFVGQNCQAEFTNNEQLSTMPFYPEDVNGVQNFTLSTPVVCKQGSKFWKKRVLIHKKNMRVTSKIEPEQIFIIFLADGMIFYFSVHKSIRQHHLVSFLRILEIRRRS